MRPLCQREDASCGACCGLYNRLDHSRDAVHRLLVRRTRALAGVPRTADAFRAAAREVSAWEEAPLFPSVRICPLLGYLDAAETRVGCLAHPLATGGVDLRDCGAYDARICESFFCPSHAWLSEAEAEIAARACARDPWLYGVVVTDVPFLRAVLSGIAALAGRGVVVADVTGEPFRRALCAVLALKEELEPGSEGLYGAFRAGADGEPVPREIDYGALARSRSPYDDILLCVGADPRSGNDLDRLEAEVRRRLDGAARALPAATAAADQA
ncbi:MAG TPA: hypothetical protein VFK85_05300 [Anaeromyxobacteraceae bacterium]|nr:hypothetical protein [Anaeromyxobacteraceae bacterium]